MVRVWVASSRLFSVPHQHFKLFSNNVQFKKPNGDQTVQTVLHVNMLTSLHFHFLILLNGYTTFH